MAVSALVTTAGSATANAYVTLAIADQYHEDRPANSSTAWSGATDAAKNAAILWATTLLDAHFNWTGWTVDSTQVLEWPRSGMWKRTGFETVSTTVIPPEIQEATAEFAKQLLAADRAADSDVETQGLTELQVDVIRMKFKEDVIAKVVPDVIANLIPAGWYESIRGHRRMSVRIVRT